MGSALHIHTKVLAGGKIEVESPELRAGDAVDVFVVPPVRADRVRLPIREALAHIRATIPAGDPEEMDRRWREERDAWDR